MSIIECPKCGKKVSDKAIKCPNCGYEVKRNTRKGYSYMKRYIVVAIVLIGVLLVWSLVLTNIISMKVSNDVKKLITEAIQNSNSNEIVNESGSLDIDEELVISEKVEADKAEISEPDAEADKAEMSEPNAEADKAETSEPNAEADNIEDVQEYQDEIPITYDSILIGERSIKIQVDKAYWANEDNGRQLIVELTIVDIGTLTSMHWDIIAFNCEFRDKEGKMIYSKNAILNSISEKNLGFSYTITIDLSDSEVDWNEVKTIKLANYA